MALTPTARPGTRAEGSNTLAAQQQIEYPNGYQSLQPSCVKHIDLYYHKIRELVEDHTIEIRYVPTHDQLADLFTKAISCDKLEPLLDTISINCSPSV